ncbi:MAG TPA: class I SAM-dependent methyltransferase [Luteimonas sp.]|nr:class I SAM-dependent methyltransferase [Luteimonas sp.]
MIDDSLLGPAFPEAGWVPAPRYLMRRARILDLARTLAPGRLLEIGPGAGVLLTEFARRGFECEALELSPAARALCAQVFAQRGTSVRLHDHVSAELEGRFDHMFAFEVLEHIEDDVAALRQWASWLKPGGHLLLSVPAHMRLWTARDTWAGHVRRYARDELAARLREGGFEVEAFDCYGFPLTNLSEWVSAPIFARQIHAGDDAAQARQANNDRSGIDRRADVRLFPLVRSLPGKLALKTAFAVQDRFLRTDLGSGYIVKARRA